MREVKRSTAVALALALMAVGGCMDDPTEVVVIVDTDLTLGTDFDMIQFRLSGQFGVGPGSFPVGTSRTLPATMGFVPAEGGRQVFDVTVSANKENFNLESTELVRRRVSNVPFVSGQMRALFVTLLRQCLCDGTACPVDAPCRDVTQPVLTEFDEDNLPRLTAKAP
jgi:hypothetical protein